MFNSKGGFLNPEQSSSRFPEKKQYNSILIPVTIKMLLDCLKNIEDDVLTIDSVKFEYVFIFLKNLHLPILFNILKKPQ
jgi:hypothetical protein